MPKICFLCKRISDKRSTLTYHRFPHDSEQRREWFENIGMEPVLSRNIFLCSKHFRPSEFYVEPTGRRVLKKDALPLDFQMSSTDVLTGASSESESISVTASSISSKKSNPDIAPVKDTCHLKVKDFRHICLTCLKPGEDLIPIFDSKVAEMLSDCNLCMISEGDDFPDKICSSCFQILKQNYKFKQMVESSYLTLSQLLFENEENGSQTAAELQRNNSFSNNEDTSRDSSDTRLTNNALMKCENNEFVKFYKNASEVEISEKQHISTEQDVKEDFEDENEDLISFLDKPLPPPLQYCCKKCLQSFSEENDLNIHQSAHNPALICLACSKKFSNRQILKRHLKTHLSKKPHVCKTCSKTFAESYALTKHLRRHSGIPREKKHMCTECGQGFSEPYYLNVHLRKHTGERPLLCSECAKPFADPRSLKVHSMIHTGEKPHRCTICSKDFIQRANLTKHMRTHTGEKPYLCQLCDKRFSQSSTLSKHLRTHSGEKLYDKCENRYTDKATLINHQKIHNETKYICKVCEQNFLTDASLHDHLHTHPEEPHVIYDFKNSSAEVP